MPLLERSQSSSREGDTQLKIGVVTYFDENIKDYAAYSIAANMGYAFQRHYSFMALSPKTGSNYEPDDPRWNRVQILRTLMTPTTKDADEHSSTSIAGAFSDYDYVVWLDADLVVLDWTGFSFEEVIARSQQQPPFPSTEAGPEQAVLSKDIILSAEHHAQTGVANTGSLIVRNSPWALRFLQRWWQQYDRTLGHDQTYFDRLYKSLSRAERTAHIAVLATPTMNSVPPAMLHQQPWHPVLHLMGEPLRFASRRSRWAGRSCVVPCWCW